MLNRVPLLSLITVLLCCACGSCSAPKNETEDRANKSKVKSELVNSEATFDGLKFSVALPPEVRLRSAQDKYVSWYWKDVKHKSLSVSARWMERPIKSPDDLLRNERHVISKDTLGPGDFLVVYELPTVHRVSARRLIPAPAGRRLLLYAEWQDGGINRDEAIATVQSIGESVVLIP